MTRPRRALLLVLFTLAQLGRSSGVQAKPQFPQSIADDLVPPLSYQVPCSVCHIKDNTGSSTAITPFALALRARGLSGDTSSLKTALTRLDADGVDSDGDGVPDIAELQAGTDPNSSANANIIDSEGPGYGCGGTAPRGRGNGGPAGAAVVAVGWLLCHRRRGRS